MSARLVFALEPLRPNLEGFLDLALDHWHETEAFRHGQGFNPDMDRYLRYNEINFYLWYSARDAGRLVGHASMYVSQSMHTQKRIATEDCWFLKPEYRQGWNAVRFHKFVEQDLRTRGVVEITQSAKNEAVGRVLQFLGYSATSQNYSKSLVLAADSGLATESVGAADVRT